MLQMICEASAIWDEESGGVRMGWFAIRVRYY